MIKVNTVSFFVHSPGLPTSWCVCVGVVHDVEKLLLKDLKLIR